MWDGQQEKETKGGTMTHCKKSLEPPVIKGLRDLELTLWVLRLLKDFMQEILMPKSH